MFFGRTTPVYDATRRQQEWNNFVLVTPACAFHLPGDTFDCMRKVDLSTLISAYTVSSKLSPEQFQFVPVIDGEGGIIPDLPSKLISAGNFSKIPLITGANLDDGTFFTPQWVSNDLEIEFLLTEGALPWQLTPPSATFLDALDRILELLSPEYKRFASIIGDVNFHEPPPHLAVANACLGVTHGTDVPYFYGTPFAQGLKTAEGELSLAMDYVISFVASLDPNDGKGSQRPNWPRYTADNQVLLQFASSNTTTVPDDYRAEQIAYLNSVSSLFGQ
ncbi:hypothetical protein GSI_08174 [Ganoderma sinense ZZ0214-1]|uniref:Carboxylesterase type B domain-containing protein n=1 Tax=Ganoderma sinense ZZ0214-1 TaxID=1077348 RepID=A0A2G8S7L6_9APHY|nr:hypothetical protein GSI_08174 [Ganoderma sinense ZZ0214-1]